MGVHLMIRGHRSNHVRPPVVGARPEQAPNGDTQDASSEDDRASKGDGAAASEGGGTAVVARTTDETVERELEPTITC
ncbi:MAG: hypothetical protein ACLFUG_11035 [Nitriliruptoraceae bacterium]